MLLNYIRFECGQFNGPAWSTEEESSFIFLELLSGSSYTLSDVIDETIATSIQNVADAVEKKAKNIAKKVNKSAKKLLKGFKKRLGN